MNIGNDAASGWTAHTANSEKAAFGLATLGLAAIMLATGASAQDAAAGSDATPPPPPDKNPSKATELPPVTLTTTPSPPLKKKTVAKKKAPPAVQSSAGAASASSAQPAGALPQDEALDATGSEAAGGEGGTAFTPGNGNSLKAGTGIGRLPGSIQSTPQIVNVVPQKQLQQQNATSVDQALRNVPGVTVASGEGGGGFTGDQFRIRGLEAKGDLYLDGLRDFGAYVRDSFSIQEIQVFKGPSSESFGVGTSGGVINLRQKAAHLGDETSIDTSIGTGPLYRTVIDVNKQIDSTTAIRAVGLFHDQDVLDRDNVYSDRWGFFGSAGFGLGTDTTLIVNYLHQDGDRRPDQSVPNILGTGQLVGRPAPELRLPRSTFHGKERDFEDTKIDMATSLFRSRLNENVTFHNDTRVALYERDFAGSVANCTGACADSFLAGGNPTLTSLGGTNYVQDAWTVQNVTSMVAKFHTGFLRHEAVAGIDMSYQEDDRQHFTAVGKTVPRIRTPELTYNDPYVLVPNPLQRREGEGTNVGAFVSDRVWFTPEISVLSGVRWDYFESQFSESALIPIDRTTEVDIWSPKASLIWEPSAVQTYYVSYATSASPIGQFVTNSSGATIGNDEVVDPVEDAESYEAGFKYSLLGGGLGLSGAVFQITKGNAVVVDPATGNAILSGEEQRVRGVEIGVTGSITPVWQVFAGYAYLESEILKSGTAANVGNEVGGVPTHSGSLWTVYNLTRGGLVGGPGVWNIGGGVIFLDEMFTVNNSANTYLLPVQYTLDALVSYEIDGWRFAANGYNLTDSLNYDASLNQRSVPSAGVSAIFSVGKKF